MKLSIREVIGILKEIEKPVDKPFEMIRADMKETFGQSAFPGRWPYKRSQDEASQG